ncbi:MAG: hypothetical protein IJ757_09140 [Clostridiales bacterium]|nr:hypothetical protein [Clostridiales bacterium]
MDEESKTFDNTVPADNSEHMEQSNNKGNKQLPKPDMKDLASSACIMAYGFVRDLKANGHTSVGNLIFQESMKMATSAAIAGESIGRDRFTENLEAGFYATGRLLVYLEFVGTLGADENVRTSLINAVTTIHKIFAASVKTVRSKQVNAGLQV